MAWAAAAEASAGEVSGCFGCGTASKGGGVGGVRSGWSLFGGVAGRGGVGGRGPLGGRIFPGGTS